MSKTRNHWRSFRRGLPALVVVSLLVLVIEVVPEILVTAFGKSGHDWRKLTVLAAFVLVALWYCMFVMWGKERGAFGRYRRPINSVVLAVLLGGAFLWKGVDPIITGCTVAACLVAGWFADRWVEAL